jgi:hypothetical protein
MPTYWCLNFDAATGPLVYKGEDLILTHGLENNLWLMQYSYRHGSHDYHEYQGNDRQGPRIITKNWNAAGSIRPGDWCAAYLRGSRFYALGKVIEPRKPKDHVDDLERTRRERGHKYLEGIVYYRDAAGAFYEDFTDEWIVKGLSYLCRYCLETRARWQQVKGVDLKAYHSPLCPASRSKFPDDLDHWPRCTCGDDAARLQRLRPYYQDHPDQLELWKYPQRVDVERWEHVVREAVIVEGLVREAHVPLYEIKKASFEIPEFFFDKIRRRLQAAARE